MRATKETTAGRTMSRVSNHRDVTLSPLKVVLEGCEEIVQAHWLAWLKKQRLDTAIPSDFSAGIARGCQKTRHGVLCKVRVGMHRGACSQFVSQGLVLFRRSAKCVRSGGESRIAWQRSLAPLPVLLRGAFTSRV
jgi:hypothetical protein